MNHLSTEQFSAKAVANQFIEFAEDSTRELTNMQLQKLVYIANGIHLGIKEEPLISDNIKAWQFGPVIPPLYNRLRKFKNGCVTERIESEDSVPDGSYAFKLIEKVWDTYGKMSGSELSTLTHMKDTPWHNTWERDGNKFGTIPNEIIAQYYKNRLRKIDV